MCKWIDAARLSKIGRARNSSKNGDRGFCLTFADLDYTVKGMFEGEREIYGLILQRIQFNLL